MGNLIGGLVVLSTVFLAVASGIFASYGVVISMLNVFGRPQSQRVPVLVPSQNQIGGD